METIFYYFSEYIMHFDRYIPFIMQNYGSLIYFLLFAIFFCETGLVVTPFLPGDSLLFACGALAATADSLHLPTLFVICLTAAILGDACNYMIGEKLGHKLIARHNRLIRPEHIEKAQKFYEKDGFVAMFLIEFLSFLDVLRSYQAIVPGN